MERRRITFWWPMTKALVDFLNEQKTEEGAPLFESIPIYPGTKGSAKKDYPCIEISYDEEGKLDLASLYNGNLRLWIDVWVESHDKEPATAFRLQDELQEKVLACLLDWPSYVRKRLGIGIHVVVDRIVSDGEIYRPSLAARIVLAIDLHYPDWEEQGKYVIDTVEVDGTAGGRELAFTVSAKSNE